MSSKNGWRLHVARRRQQGGKWGTGGQWEKEREIYTFSYVKCICVYIYATYMDLYMTNTICDMKAEGVLFKERRGSSGLQKKKVQKKIMEVKYEQVIEVCGQGCARYKEYNNLLAN